MKVTLPKELSVVVVVLSVTSIGSVPGVVEVIVNVAIPDESKIADAGEMTVVPSEGAVRLTESPVSGVGVES